MTPPSTAARLAQQAVVTRSAGTANGTHPPRVGQLRDVFLYNLVATDTREGDTLFVLLDNFVKAANELRGQMFDSLSAVAEITGVDYEKWLTDLYGNDDAKKHAAIAAATAVHAHDLTRAARQVQDTERRLASQVDAVAALTLLQRDLFARINPAIVESYLDRLPPAMRHHENPYTGATRQPPSAGCRAAPPPRPPVARGATACRPPRGSRCTDPREAVRCARRRRRRGKVGHVILPSDQVVTEFYPVILALRAWGETWCKDPNEPLAVHMTHRTCGTEVRLDGVCPACQVFVLRSEIDATPSTDFASERRRQRAEFRNSRGREPRPTRG